MSEEQISVIDVAQIHGRNKQHIFKVLKRLGIESTLEKSGGSRGQKIAYILKADYELLLKPELGAVEDSSSAGMSESGPGYFYLIQLEPTHDPGRFKVGFATSVEERMRSHKTAAPLCKLVNSWPCKLLWEKTAIDSVTNGCERLYTEVFRTESVTDIENRCNQFFKLMPNLE